MGKAFEKQTKTIEDQGKKQVDALVALKPKNDVKVKLDKTLSISNNYFKDRLDEIKKHYKPIDEDDLEIYDNATRTFINFLSHEDPINLFYNITNGTLKDAKDLQKSFKKRIKNLKDYDISNSEKYKID